MRITRRLTAALVACILLLLAVSAPAQSTSTQIQVALNNLITGITTFTTARITAGRYILWGTASDAAGYGFRDNSGTLQYKASTASSWLNFSSSATLPTAASFITRVAEADLSNETALSTLATAILVNTTTTGVPTAYGGTTCTNQFPRSLSAIGAATCASVALTADVTGTLPVANGGLGIATGTSGGILGFTAAGTIGSSGALTQYALVVGGGAGATPTVLAGLGTTTTLLHGNAAGAPTFGAVSLTADVSGILPTANGGTGIAYFTAAGPTVARVYTFPDAATTILTTNAAVTAAQGGTGQTSYAVGDILYASAGTTLSKLADVATGNALIAGGVTTAPSWGKIGLTTHVSGTLPVGNGGTGLASYTTGDILTASSGSTLASIIDVTAGSFLRSGGAGVIPAWSTTTWPNAATAGDLILATGANAMGSLADVAVNRVLVSGGVGVVPAYSNAPIVATLQGTTSLTAGSGLALGTTSTDGIINQNTTAATGGTQVQISPRARFRGTAWDTAASETVDFFLENLPAAAATPTGTWKLGYSLNGGGATYPLTVSSAGTVVALGTVQPGGSGLTVANVAANTCGTTAATIAGNNNANVVTVGATSGTQCRVAFTYAAPTEWDCAAADNTTTVAVRTTPVDTTHTDYIGTFTAADKVTGICFPR